MSKVIPIDDKAQGLEGIRDAVERRVKKEASTYPQEAQGAAEQTPSNFIKRCLWAKELGDGILYATVNRDRYLYNATMGSWMVWAGHYWTVDIMEQSLAAVEAVSQLYLDEYTRTQLEKNERSLEYGDSLNRTISTLEKRVGKLRTDHGRRACRRFARSNEQDDLSISGEDFDRNPWLLGCANGVMDLRTAKFRNGRGDDLISRASPTEWLGLTTPAQLWERTLFEILNGDMEIVAYLQRFLGYSLTGLTNERVFAIWQGRGFNGKGTIVHVLSRILGPLAQPIRSELLLDQGRVRNSAGPSPDIMVLKGLRLAFASETEQGRRFSLSNVKWLTGGDELTARNPHDKWEITFPPSHQLILMTNSKPRVPTDDYAFWNRVHLLPFEMSFVNRKPLGHNERRADKNLYEKLMEEASGILAWLVRGCIDYQRRGLDPPSTVLEATARYRKDEDLLAEFLESCCVLDGEIKEKSTELYDQFKIWYANNISQKGILSHRKFGLMMGGRFVKRKIEGVMYYLGLGIKKDT